MVCPCAITNEDVDYPFSIEDELTFTFDKGSDLEAFVIEGDTFDLLLYVKDLIIQEIPIKVVKKGKIDYPKGDGWQIMSEEDYEKSKNEKLDPRLAILKDFKFDDKEE